jgi:hypothetical protein
MRRIVSLILYSIILYVFKGFLYKMHDYLNESIRYIEIGNEASSQNTRIKIDLFFIKYDPYFYKKKSLCNSRILTSSRNSVD